MDICALGELLIDFTPMPLSAQGNPVFERNPGGAPANVCVQAARLGRSTALLCCVGEDAFGCDLLEILAENGVNTRGARRTAKAGTTLAFVHLAADGERSFTFYRNPGADTCLRPEDLDESLLRGCRIFHMGSLSLTHEPARTATLRAKEIARQTGALISYDPNYRAMLWPDEQTAREQMLGALPGCDIVKVSEEEFSLLFGMEPERGAREVIARYGISLLAVTRGARGSFFCGPQGFGQAAPFAVNAVDTTGSGDAFMGTLLAGVLDCGKHPGKLSTQEMHHILRRANAAGALCATRRGGIPALADREELDAFMGEWG